MGIERGHYATSGSYRASRDYGPRSGGGYAATDTKHYDNYGKYDSYGNGSLTGKNDRDYSDSGSKFAGSREGPEQAILGIEKQIVNVKRDMNQAIQEATTKDNEKFDLIFSILTELQRRQASLEESIRGLKSMFGPDGRPIPQAQQSPSCPSNAMPMNSGGAMPMPLGGQGFMMAPGPPQMGQQFMAPDGTPMQVVVMSPGQAGQMYGMPQMMPPAGTMPGAMPPMGGQFTDANGVVCDFNGQPGEQPQLQAPAATEGAEQQQPQDDGEQSADVKQQAELEALNDASSGEKAPQLCVEEEE